jgi:hypothetical protein
MTRVFVVGFWDAIGEHLAVSRLPEQDEPYDVTYPGFAVTEELRAALPGLDDEGLEHYAMTEAAQASLGYFLDEGEPMRRLVIAVEAHDVAPAQVAAFDGQRLDPEHPGLVDATFALPDDVVAWLVDTDDARETVRAAVSAIATGDDNTDELVERCLDHELAWYAAAEVDEVMRLR